MSPICNPQVCLLGLSLIITALKVKKEQLYPEPQSLPIIKD